MNDFLTDPFDPYMRPQQEALLAGTVEYADCISSEE